MLRVIVAAVAALLAVPVAASARVIQAETVLPPGQSGHVPQNGTNPHLNDQTALFESFSFKPAGFDPRRVARFAEADILCGLTTDRDAGQVIRAAGNLDEVGVQPAAGRQRQRDRIAQFEEHASTSYRNPPPQKARLCWAPQLHTDAAWFGCVGRHLNVAGGNRWEFLDGFCSVSSLARSPNS